MGRTPAFGLVGGLRHIVDCSYCMMRLESERRTVDLIRMVMRTDSGLVAPNQDRLVVVDNKLATDQFSEPS